MLYNHPVNSVMNVLDNIAIHDAVDIFKLLNDEVSGLQNVDPIGRSKRCHQVKRLAYRLIAFQAVNRFFSGRQNSCAIPKAL